MPMNWQHTWPCLSRVSRFVLWAALLFASNTVLAQYSLRIVVTQVATKPLDDIYVAGSFNNWNPGDTKYKLQPFGRGRKAIVIKDIADGTVIEFKLTRGNFSKVETTAKGVDITNRTVTIDADKTLEISIPGWKDDFPEKPKSNTATTQVSILDTGMYMPQLKRNRRIWLYLPASYAKLPNKRFPVIYMHDAQNLFNEQLAPYGEWGLDECLDSLQKQTGKECIVVAIEHGGDKRIQEYNPYPHEKYGQGEGDAYVQFIAQTLKPLIDKKYRTVADAAHTAIAGSSMGGLISLYAVLQYPKTFGIAGVFSPSLWIAPNLYQKAQTFSTKGTVAIYLYAGGKEGGNPKTAAQQVEEMAVMFDKNPHISFTKIVYPNGQHNEATWRQEIDDWYKWLAGKW